MSNEQRRKALALVAMLKNKYGDSVHTGKTMQKTQFMKTGHPMVDYVMGGKGIPIGRITEMYGNEGSGKTSLAICIASAFQKQKGVVVWVNGEKTLDMKYAKRLGLDGDEIVVLDLSEGEEVITAISNMLKSPEPPSLVVIDSVASITSSSEIEAGMDDSRPAVNARMWNKAMRIWNAINKDTTILLINQIRYGIGGRGNNISVGGGMGIKFHASLRVEVKSGMWIKDKDDVIGHIIRMRSEKNKVTGFPHRAGEIEWYYDLRSTYLDQLSTFAALTGAVTRTGAWITFNGKKYQGVKGLKAALDKDKALRKILEERAYSTEIQSKSFKESDVPEE